MRFDSFVTKIEWHRLYSRTFAAPVNPSPHLEFEIRAYIRRVLVTRNLRTIPIFREPHSLKNQVKTRNFPKASFLGYGKFHQTAPQPVSAPATGSLWVAPGHKLAIRGVLGPTKRNFRPRGGQNTTPAKKACSLSCMPPSHHYIPIKSKSSNDTVSVVSCFGFAYFTNTAFLLWL